MPTMELSSGFIPGYLSRMVGGWTDYYYYNMSFINVSHTSPLQYSKLRIMKGTVPTDFSTLTNVNTSRSTDILIDYSYFHNGSNISSVNTTNPVTLSSILVAASASGTATWFWYVGTSSSTGAGNAPPANTPNQQFIGTVGLTGSGADLEIDNVNIVSGSSYKFTNLKIQLPTSWTW